jgi:hypothetical protein
MSAAAKSTSHGTIRKMPNWCYNSLELYNNDQDELKKLFKYMAETDQTYNKLKRLFFYFVGEKNICCDVRYSCFDMYTENINNEENPHIDFKFDSAWSPPHGFYEFISENKKGWKVVASAHESVYQFLHYFETTDIDDEEEEDDYISEEFLYDFKDSETMEYLLENLPQYVLDNTTIVEDYQEWKDKMSLEKNKGTV